MSIVKETSHYFSDGVYAKQMALPKGHTALTHSHIYDHLSILSQGEVFITCNGTKIHAKAPYCINIKAGVEHQIDAIEDAIFYCIHAISEADKQLNNIDKVLIMNRDDDAMG
jgi:quercetin dioxygenase-like cupin family protein